MCVCVCLWILRRTVSLIPTVFFRLFFNQLSTFNGHCATMTTLPSLGRRRRTQERLRAQVSLGRHVTPATSSCGTEHLFHTRTPFHLPTPHATRVPGGIKEKIHESKPGESLTYSIISGAFPATDHQGTLTFTELPESTAVRSTRTQWP